ncbi:hypothetical protein BDV19DRAFT_362196 [Aspergillus venezuelensis]
MDFGVEGVGIPLWVFLFPFYLTAEFYYFILPEELIPQTLSNISNFRVSLFSRISDSRPAQLYIQFL